MFYYVLLRFILFVYTYLCYVELSKYPFYMWNSSDPKGKFPFYAVIINNDVLL